MRSYAQSAVGIINRELQLTDLLASPSQNIDAKSSGAKKGISEYQASCVPTSRVPPLFINGSYQDEPFTDGPISATRLQQQAFEPGHHGQKPQYP